MTLYFSHDFEVIFWWNCA